MPCGVPLGREKDGAIKDDGSPGLPSFSSHDGGKIILLL
jgi:hypothetical protein